MRWDKMKGADNMCFEVKDVEMMQPEIVRFLTYANDPCRTNMIWMRDTEGQGTPGNGNSTCKGTALGRIKVYMLRGEPTW